MTIDTYRPKVSIVMSFHNEPLQWIRFAVESILEQTLQNIELIIVCDNPDHAEGISYIRSLHDKRIRFIINPENVGPTKSFNTAIAVAEGEYIARMDADDISLPKRLQTQVEYLDSHPEVSVCATDTHTIDKEGKITRRNRYKRKKDIALMFISNCIAHPSVMFRKNLLEVRNPIYNEDYRYSQDYELWLFLILNGHKIHMIDRSLLLYRKHGIQISTEEKILQAELAKKAHKSFINKWLSSKKIITAEQSDDLKCMLKMSSDAYSSLSDPEEKRRLMYVIYVLYYSLGSLDWKYRLKYLTAPQLMVFRIRVIFTLRLLFSSRKRRNRINIS